MRLTYRHGGIVVGEERGRVEDWWEEFVFLWRSEKGWEKKNRDMKKTCDFADDGNEGRLGATGQPTAKSKKIRHNSRRDGSNPGWGVGFCICLCLNGTDWGVHGRKRRGFTFVVRAMQRVVRVCVFPLRSFG